MSPSKPPARALGSPTPNAWRAYSCDDYFASGLAETGWWDEDAQYWLIEPAARMVEDVALRFLDIGGPGVDGIRWGYRRGRAGVWAHYPIEGEFVRLADTAMDLMDRWRAGTLML